MKACLSGEENQRDRTDRKCQIIYDNELDKREVYREIKIANF